MNKQLLLFSIVVCTAFTVSVNLYFNSQKRNMRLTDLVLTNVEALAQEESVKIPCEYKEGETCTFKVITPSGLEGEATAIDAIKVK